MATDLVPSGEPETLEAVHVLFEGVDFVAVKAKGKHQGITLQSIADQLAGIEETQQWQRIMNDSNPVWISVNGGKAHKARVIRKSRFLLVASTHPRFKEWGDKVELILERLDNGETVAPAGLSLSPEQSNHPLVKMSELVHQLTCSMVLIESKVGEHDGRIADHSKRLTSLEDGRLNDRERFDRTENHMEELRDSLTKTKGRTTAIAGLERRGWKFPNDIKGPIGRQCAAIARERGDLYFEALALGLENMHEQETLDVWEDRHGPAYRDAHYDSRRDRHRPQGGRSLVKPKTASEAQGVLPL